MKPAKVEAGFGLPGKVTEVGLTLRPGLSVEEWVDALRLLGRLAGGMSWWLGDALLYGDERYGEKFAQYVHETGLQPHTIQNIMWVAKAVPASRRRDTLSWSHHAAVAGLDPEDQAHWLGVALAGEHLPSGETKPWSATKLKEQLRALSPAKKPARGPEKAQEPTSPSPASLPVQPEKSSPDVVQDRKLPDIGAASPAQIDALPPAGVSEPLPLTSPCVPGKRCEVSTHGPCEVVAIYGASDLPAILEPHDVLIQCRRLNGGPFLPSQPAKKGRQLASAPVKDWSKAPWGTPEALAHLYNEATPDNVPAVESLSVKRRQKAALALRQFPERSWWDELFSEYRRSKFLSGRAKMSTEHAGWKPSFDWLLGNNKNGTENYVVTHDGGYRE